MTIMCYLGGGMYHVYIMASHSGTLYIGVTNNLHRRVWDHKNKVGNGFTQKYDCIKLVYFEGYDDIAIASQREKQLKKWNRQKKQDLITSLNPHWEDLTKKFGFGI